MSVYVDDLYRSPVGRLGRMKMSHMIGVNRKWIQKQLVRVVLAAAGVR